MNFWDLQLCVRCASWTRYRSVRRRVGLQTRLCFGFLTLYFYCLDTKIIQYTNKYIWCLTEKQKISFVDKYRRRATSITIGTTSTIWLQPGFQWLQLSLLTHGYRYARLLSHSHDYWSARRRRPRRATAQAHGFPRLETSRVRPIQDRERR